MNEFRRIRLENNLSQSQAAKIMELPLSTVQKWDGGFRPVRDRVVNEFILRLKAHEY